MCPRQYSKNRKGEKGSGRLLSYVSNKNTDAVQGRGNHSAVTVSKSKRTLTAVSHVT